ncbi:hypothetical protein EA187_00970 [Lujinxingia sediminis]|uniref:Cbb3-type cytochrome c oxidase subunit I n=1 Tax=Lujinxingia sediminis TaxID=2480984 RepID=A0ABY0CVY2_9DELT|nr:hypothetical protein [Lujinxingia sediminis]RVU48038.1 hypothetical protein EA187_00970 [Lujinxingia sediminis]
MAPLSIHALRLAILHLVVGLSAGALLLANKGPTILPLAGLGSTELLRIHHHTLLFGWTVQLVMGVAYWILPTFGARTERGSERAMLVALIALNLGVVLAVAGLRLEGWGLQAIAALSFGVHAWPRVKAFGESG